MGIVRSKEFKPPEGLERGTGSAEMSTVDTPLFPTLSPICRLSPDTFSLIADQLETGDVLSLALSCRTLHQALVAKLGEQIDFTFFQPNWGRRPTIERSSYGETMNRDMRKLHDTELSRRVVDLFTLSATQRAPRSLIIPRNAGQAANVFAQLLRVHRDTLQRLEIRHDKTVYFEPQLARRTHSRPMLAAAILNAKYGMGPLRNLRSLSLTDTIPMGDSTTRVGFHLGDWIPLIALCPSLEYLAIHIRCKDPVEFCDCCEDLDEDPLWEGASRQLKHLSLHMGNPLHLRNTILFKAINRWASLRKIEAFFDDDASPMDTFAGSFASDNAIAELSINGDGDDDTGYCEDWLGFPALQLLKERYPFRWGPARFESCEYIPRHPALQHYILFNCNAVTVYSQSQQGMARPRLTAASRISQEVVIQLADSPNLTTIQFVGSHNTPDNSHHSQWVDHGRRGVIIRSYVFGTEEIFHISCLDPTREHVYSTLEVHSPEDCENEDCGNDYDQDGPSETLCRWCLLEDLEERIYHGASNVCQFLRTFQDGNESFTVWATEAKGEMITSWREYTTEYSGAAIPLSVFEEMRSVEAISEHGWDRRGVPIGKAAWTVLDKWKAEQDKRRKRWETTLWWQIWRRPVDDYPRGWEGRGKVVTSAADSESDCSSCSEESE